MQLAAIGLYVFKLGGLWIDLINFYGAERHGANWRLSQLVHHSSTDFGFSQLRPGSSRFYRLAWAGSKYYETPLPLGTLSIHVRSHPDGGGRPLAYRSRCYGPTRICLVGESNVAQQPRFGRLDKDEMGGFRNRMSMVGNKISAHKILR